MIFKTKQAILFKSIFLFPFIIFQECTHISFMFDIILMFLFYIYIFFIFLKFLSLIILFCCTLFLIVGTILNVDRYFTFKSGSYNLKSHLKSDTNLKSHNETCNDTNFILNYKFFYGNKQTYIFKKIAYFFMSYILQIKIIIPNTTYFTNNFFVKKEK